MSFKNLEGEELEEAKLQYQCKEKNVVFYLQVRELFVDFYKLLEEMLHGWDMNIIEGINPFFTKFLSKNRTYVMTIENKVRLCLAVSIDSVGYIKIRSISINCRKNRTYLLQHSPTSEPQA